MGQYYYGTILVWGHISVESYLCGAILVWAILELGHISMESY